MTTPSNAMEQTAATPPDASSMALPRRTFHAGEVLFREGEAGDESYLLDEGMVRLIKRVRGADRSFVVLRPGDLFGESALVGSRPRNSTAVAMGGGSARSLTRANLAALMARDSDSAARIVEQLARRLADAEDQVEIMMLSDSQSKVVSALLKLSQDARLGGPGAAFTISPMELSAKIGLDIDTVKRVVHQLREGQYVRVTESRLEIPDLDALRRLYTLLGAKDEIRNDV